MKKRNAILSSVLAGAMLLSLTACGQRRFVFFQRGRDRRLFLRCRHR